jgi:2-oxoglutarate dehydrogenase E1 component
VSMQTLGVVRPLRDDVIHADVQATPPDDVTARDALHHRNSGNAQAYVEAYRLHGYLRASINPLMNGVASRRQVAELDPARYGLSVNDTVTHLVHLGGAYLAVGTAELTAMLESRYCGSIALSSAHIRDTDQRRWLHTYMERRAELHAQGSAASAMVLRQLVAAETFEHHLKTAYPNVKLFSLEGNESLIPLLCRVLEQAAEQEMTDVVIGMPHRGRLNVLANVVGVPHAQLFSLFGGKPHPGLAAWDVKDHLGYAARRATRHGEINVLLAHNPSHLESIDPVVCGMARALHERRADGKPRRAMAVLLHGDAAFCAQGIVTETLNLSQTRGYHIGGTLHVIVNNQIGSTLSHPRDARSMLHCADVARSVDAPILHVNADDPDAVVFAAQLAMEYRAAFSADVVIDLIGYRRFGHTGHDDPSMTQPAMQRKIRTHASSVDQYAEKLVQRGQLQAILVQNMRNEAHEMWAKATEEAAAAQHQPAPAPARPAARAPYVHWSGPVRTAVPADRLRGLLSRLITVPANFQAHPHIDQLLADWQGVLAGERTSVEWRLAENLAYASLLTSGFNVRVTGLDVGRGSFFHRQAVWHNQAGVTDGENTHVPLRQLSADQAAFSVFDTALSEEAVLGFEYGYALQSGRDLVVWEAQFGDFVNNAQVIIDQYIASGEAKWGYSNGLVVMLPHGHDGGGPEHSSGYLGRFLALCAQDNMRVVVPSNSAQLFHLLRRQALVDERKPLIVMTPKPSVYNNAATHAPWSDLAQGDFQTVIGDVHGDPRAVERAVLVSGKLYYDLVAERAQRGLQHAAILRVEQLYPFPAARLAAELARYPNLREVVWAQEEHKNHGAWHLVRDCIEEVLPPMVSLQYAGRVAAAPSAVCDAGQHKAEQRAVVEQALGR